MSDLTINWTVRQYREGDETAIRDLFRVVFSKEMNSEEWRWRYQENPASFTTIVVAESPAKKIVGQYALMPVPMKIGNEKCHGTLSLDTMTHPDYRNQGMFIKLARYNFDAIGKKNIPLTYGFPNKNSQHGFFKRLNWINLTANAPIYLCPLRIQKVLQKKLRSRLGVVIVSPFVKIFLALAKITKRPSQKDPVRIEKINSFDQRWDVLWSEVKARFPIAVWRDANYLNWRYCKNPLFQYDILAAFQREKLVGYCVLRQGTQFDLKMGYVMDVLGIHDFAIHQLLAESLKKFRDAECDVVTILMLPPLAKKYHIRGLGFLRMPKWLMPQDLYLGVCQHQENLPANFLGDPKNWYISWGDHDRT